MAKCDCFHQEYGRTVCWGTREKDECACGGDRFKCTFYPEIRKKSRQKMAENTLYTINGTRSLYDGAKIIPESGTEGILITETGFSPVLIHPVKLKAKQANRARWVPINESEITGFDPELAGKDPVGSYVCSKCNKEAIFSCDDEYVLSPYCPWCGKPMEVHGVEREKNAAEENTQKSDPWIQYRECKPSCSSDYLTYTEQGLYQVLHYSKEYDLWNVFDGCTKRYAIKAVTHWAPLLPPQKNECTE